MGRWDPTTRYDLERLLPRGIGTRGSNRALMVPLQLQRGIDGGSGMLAIHRWKNRNQKSRTKI